MKKVVVLGATGSIGDSTFRVLKGLGPEYQVVGISGGKQLDKLAALAQVWQPAWVGVAEKGTPRPWLPNSREPEWWPGRRACASWRPCRRWNW